MFSARMAAAPIRLRGAKQRHPDGYGDGGDTAHASLGPWGRCSVVTEGLRARSFGWLQAEPGHGTPRGIQLGRGSARGRGTPQPCLIPGARHSLIQAPTSPRAPPHGTQVEAAAPATPNLPLISTSTALCPPPEQPSINTSPFSSLHSFPRLWFPDSDPT